MQRRPWTIAQWCSRTCAYTIRQPHEPLGELFIRNMRIPHVDKISRRLPDPRIPRYVSASKKHTEVAAQLLLDYMPNLDHNTLEELTFVLALRVGCESVPIQVRERLERLGIYPFLADAVKRWQLTGHKPTLSASARPVDILELPLPDGGVLAKQDLIDQASSYSPRLSGLSRSWSAQLRRIKERAVLDPSLETFLSFEDQCGVVARELCAITAQIASTPFPRSLSQVCRRLGDAIEHMLLSKVAHKHGVPLIHRRSRLLWGMLGQPRWTTKQRIIHGSWWIEQALKNCRFDLLFQGRSVSRPAFWRTWHFSGSTKRGIFVLNQSLLKILRSEPDACSNYLTSAQFPMLVAPRPWTSVRSTTGPKAMHDLTLIASNGHSTEGQFTLKEAIRSGAMDPHLEGLNRLSQQAWRINKRVLEVLSELGPHAILKSGNGAQPEVPTAQWQQALRVARALGDQRFYLPAYSDFRGRAYAHSGTILNYMNKDPLRALFLFGEKVPLGRYGLHWLEVQLANVYGACKSMSERHKRLWVESNRSNVLSSAASPLTCDWWMSASKPFQTLAACFELHDAWNSANPASFESRLPVQLDGTCNGLQHLVSLARDEANAGHVNVTSTKEKGCGDVYTAVAEQVAGEQILPITRCMVKDAVMTFFYGATLHGTLESLRQHGVQATEAVARRIRDCLHRMFWREREIQLWLIECARRITHSCRADQAPGTTTVAWTSPLGMPVVQPYSEPKLMAVRTSLQTFYLPSEFHPAVVDRKKQMAAIVANYVHSLDAAHMLATARALPSSVAFIAVHDSFWSRAGEVPVLSRVLREQFAWLHSTDLLSELRQEWSERYRGYMVLGKAYEDSALYRKAVRARDGVLTGPKQQKCLDEELKQWYYGRAQLKTKGPVHWDNGEPFVGTPGLRSVRVWYPLDFPMPPERGTLDVNEVLRSSYFFS